MLELLEIKYTGCKAAATAVIITFKKGSTHHNHTWTEKTVLQNPCANVLASGKRVLTP